MKKNLFFFLALTVFSSVSFARNLETPPASLRMGIIRSGSTFKVFYKGTSLNKVTVNIYDAKGAKLFSDNLGFQENFVRPYNFSELAEGNYTIELVDGLGKQLESVSYSKGKVEKLGTLIKMADGSGKYLLIVPSKGRDVLKVTITDASGEVVYQNEESVESDFAKIFDLKSISKDFTLSITDSKGATKHIHYWNSIL
jgi:hypothetical protein